MKIEGSTILVTGGGSGIGRALAEEFHARRAKVIIAGRRAQPLEAVVAANPGMAHLVLDVAEPASIRAAAETLARDHPALDTVIHNAGIMKAERIAADPYDLADAEATIATNLLGPIRLTAALLPQLKARGRATIMTVSSGLAFVPLAMTPTYCATKAAIHSWSDSLRAQLDDHGIDVVELIPPAVQTDLMPGHAENPTAMPLADYVAEVTALIERYPNAREIVVERCRPLRAAQDDAAYAKAFAMLNAAR